MTTSNEVPKFLDELLRAGAPSGYEGPAAEVWRKAASDFAELSYDGIGSTIARVGEAEPLVAIVGHIDEIGLIITHIDEKVCRLILHEYSTILLFIYYLLY